MNAGNERIMQFFFPFSVSGDDVEDRRKTLSFVKKFPGNGAAECPFNLLRFFIRMEWRIDKGSVFRAWCKNIKQMKNRIGPAVCNEWFIQELQMMAGL